MMLTRRAERMARPWQMASGMQVQSTVASVPTCGRVCMQLSCLVLHACTWPPPLDPHLPMSRYYPVVEPPVAGTPELLQDALQQVGVALVETGEFLKAVPLPSPSSHPQRSITRSLFPTAAIMPLMIEIDTLYIELPNKYTFYLEEAVSAFMIEIGAWVVTISSEAVKTIVGWMPLPPSPSPPLPSLSPPPPSPPSPSPPIAAVAVTQPSVSPSPSQSALVCNVSSMVHASCSQPSANATASHVLAQPFAAPRWGGTHCYHSPPASRSNRSRRAFFASAYLHPASVRYASCFSHSGPHAWYLFLQAAEHVVDVPVLRHELVGLDATAEARLRLRRGEATALRDRTMKELDRYVGVVLVGEDEHRGEILLAGVLLM